MSEAMINPEIVNWARQRARLALADVADKMKQKPAKLEEWEAGESRPTFKQAQTLAKQLKVPFGYLFLQKPPEEQLAIPDLRTVGSIVTPDLGQNFRDLLNDILTKQEWFKEYLIENGQDKLDFIGSHTIHDDPVEVARHIAATLNVTDALRKEARNWEHYLTCLIERVENAGILVMRSGIVGSNTRRTLSVDEFRGFAISDEYAPLVFINSTDAPPARLFTLIHELAHLWVGTSGISNMPLNETEQQEKREEVFCNQVAAEFLVPTSNFLKDWDTERSMLDNCNELRKIYKVSKMVVARRALDLGLIPRDQYLEFYRTEINSYKQSKGSGGGDFSRNLLARNGRLFSTAVVGSTMEGRLLLRDATRLLNITKANTFKGYAKSLNLD